MKIHAIQTGTVALTTKWREGVGHGRRRLVNTLLDREWTEPLPIYAFAIEAVVVEDGDHAVFLAADSSYTQDALLRGAVDGVGPDEAAERLTHERVRAYAATTPTVYLPTHDPETAARLAERRTIGAAREQAIA